MIQLKLRLFHVDDNKSISDASEYRKYLYKPVIFSVVDFSQVHIYDEYDNEELDINVKSISQIRSDDLKIDFICVIDTNNVELRFMIENPIKMDMFAFESSFKITFKYPILKDQVEKLIKSNDVESVIPKHISQLLCFADLHRKGTIYEITPEPRPNENDHLGHKTWVIRVADNYSVT